jgi:hypothetical protein
VVRLQVALKQCRNTGHAGRQGERVGPRGVRWQDAGGNAKHFTLRQILLEYEIKEDVIDGACSACGYERREQSSGLETWREETTLKTLAQMCECGIEWVLEECFGRVWTGQRLVAGSGEHRSWLSGSIMGGWGGFHGYLSDCRFWRTVLGE